MMKKERERKKERNKEKKERKKEKAFLWYISVSLW
jgi:hypothetical protein